MYSKEIDQLKTAINALDVLIEGTSNIHTSIDSITLNSKPLEGVIDALLYSRQNLLTQLSILEAAQLKAQELVPAMEQ
jgi:hypothetical protein